MCHSSTCRACGAVVGEAHLKPETKREWVNGFFDQYSIWHPGRFK